MKIITLVISLLALISIAFNLTKVNFNDPLEGESMTALITIMVALCAIVLMLILRVSKRIEEKVKQSK